MAYDESSILEVIEKVTQSVVNINTVRLLHDFYYQVVPVQGMGSGFIIDPKGYIITNNHVIGGAEKIGVTMASGEVLPGKIVGTCVSDDIAVVKVDGKNLPTAELGDSDQLGGTNSFRYRQPIRLSWRSNSY